MYTYKTKGTCSRSISFDVDGDDRLTELHFEGGCNGNLKGISQLCKGMKIDDIIDRLENTVCGMKGTSCPDQLARALKEYKASRDTESV